MTVASRYNDTVHYIEYSFPTELNSVDLKISLQKYRNRAELKMQYNSVRSEFNGVHENCFRSGQNDSRCFSLFCGKHPNTGNISEILFFAYFEGM